MDKLTRKDSSDNILLLSDCHFGSNKDSILKLNDLCGYLKNNVISICKENEINTILFLGDWFDKRETINVHTLNRSNSIIRLFKKNNIELIMILGNHDIYYKNRNDIHSLDSLKEYENVEIVENITELNYNNRTFLLAPWGLPMPESKSYDTVFGHFEFVGASLCGAINRSGRNPIDLLSYSDLVFSGHFHIQKEYNYSKGKIITVGNPLQMTWGDFGNDKGVYIFNTKDLSYKFVPNTTSRIYRKIYWSEIISKKEKLDNITGNYVKFVIDENTKFDYTLRMINIINSKSPVSCEPEVTISQNSEFNTSSTNPISIDNEILEASTQKQIEKYLEIIREEGWFKKESIDEPTLNNLIDMYFKKVNVI